MLAVNCVAVAGFSVLPGVDHTGDDIRRSGKGGDSVATLAAACRADTRCRSFNSAGYLKTATTITDSNLPDNCFYVLTAPGDFCTPAGGRAPCATYCIAVSSVHDRMMQPRRSCCLYVGQAVCDGDGDGKQVYLGMPRCHDVRGNRGTLLLSSHAWVHARDSAK